VAAATPAQGFTATYELQVKEADKDTYKTVGSIDIPKDMVATKGELVEEDAEGNAGTFIKMTIANGEAFYINVANLIEYNSYADSDTISSEAVSGQAHQYKFNVIDGSITETKLNTSVNASLDLADSALQKADITAGAANGTIAVGGTDVTVTGLKSAAFAETSAFDAAGTAQGLINELDSTQTATEGKYISGITQVDGKITAIAETALPAAATLVTGTANGTVAFNGTDIAVKGLGSAAY